MNMITLYLQAATRTCLGCQAKQVIWRPISAARVYARVGNWRGSPLQAATWVTSSGNHRNGTPNDLFDRAETYIISPSEGEGCPLMVPITPLATADLTQNP